MHIRNHLALGLVAASLALAAAYAHDVDAQPADRKERRDAIREKIKGRIQDKKDAHQDKKEELKEKRDEIKEKRAERRDQFREQRARHKELKDKEQAGELTDDEKQELAKLEEGQAQRKQRHEALKARHDELKQTRKQRRVAERRKIHEKYPNLHKHPAAVAEFKKHARRIAHLDRAKEVAKADERAEMETKIDALITAENARHDSWVAKHRAAWADKQAEAAAEGAK